MRGYDRVPTRDDTNVVGQRVGASIIDSIVLVVLVVVVFLGIGVTLGRTSIGTTALGIWTVLITILAVQGYFFLLEGLWDGQTIGKKAVDIKVVRDDGSECTVGAAVVRNLLRPIDGIFYYAIGFISMALSDRRQRLGDRLAGTVVVRESPRSVTRERHDEPRREGRGRSRRSRPQRSRRR